MFQRLVSAAFGVATFALSTGAMAQFFEGADSSSDPNSGAAFSVIIVPEPGTLALLVGGLACIALLRSRRKS
jgi:hypothetical protein